MATTRERVLLVRGPYRKGDCEVLEIEDPELRLLSAVALHQDREPDIPGLGGTRWLEPEGLESFRALRRRAVEEAVRLAGAMQSKLTLLRRAAGEESTHLLFTGGKGVIAGSKPAALGELERQRLKLHARLLLELAGSYLASKDAGVATPELEVIEKEARRLAPDLQLTIGLECERDTGEATAMGVLAGIEQAVLEEELAVDPERPLLGLAILVVGVGKVGLPLVRMLVEVGADVYVYDPGLVPDLTAAQEWVAELAADKAAVHPNDGMLLASLVRRGRVLPPEDEKGALSDTRFTVVSPNGGLTDWLSGEIEGVRRFELLAAAGRAGRLRLILGAGNYQLPLSSDAASAERRAVALRELGDAGVRWIPDALVSPGGVIAVSHERLPTWDPEAVNADARRVVRNGVAELYRRARSGGCLDDPLAFFAEFEEMSGRGGGR